MIKINLATRKMATGVQAQAPGTGLTLQSLQRIRLGDITSHPRFNEFAIFGFVIIATQTYWQLHVNASLDEADDRIAELKKGQSKIQAEVDGIKKYEKIKKDVEGDEKVIREKLEIILTLLKARTVEPRLMVSLSNAIPSTVWLNTVSIDQKAITMSGMATDYAGVSEFGRNLSSSIYFKDLTTPREEKAIENNIGVVKFDISLSRR